MMKDFRMEARIRRHFAYFILWNEIEEEKYLVGDLGRSCFLVSAGSSYGTGDGGAGLGLLNRTISEEIGLFKYLRIFL